MKDMPDSRHDPEKWKPVFRTEQQQSIRFEAIAVYAEPGKN
jgi:hypothetical protein